MVKLPKGVTIWQGKKKYKGECPEHVYQAYTDSAGKTSKAKPKPEPKETKK
jgi:hypothetical protein